MQRLLDDKENQIENLIEKWKIMQVCYYFKNVEIK